MFDWLRRREFRSCMNRFLRSSRPAAGVSLGLLLLASSPSSAYVISAPGCRNAEKLSDGSWQIMIPTSFGRAGPVESGSLVVKGEVINGVDLWGELETRCLRWYTVNPDYPPFMFPPSGWPSWISLIR